LIVVKLPIMPAKSETPPELGPEANEAVSQLRDGLRRAHRIVREAKQAIGQPPTEGALLPADAVESPVEADQNGPVISAD